jgi:Uri superfamily endonuclease
MNPLPELKTDLYRVGRRYTARRTELTTAQKKTPTWKAVAAEFGTAPEHVRHAARFAAAVDRIAANCGPDAKAVLLKEHPRLPAKVVTQLANTHAERQQYALAQVRIDRDPFDKPPSGIDPPFDTHSYTEVLGRKARTAGTLDAIAGSLLFTPRANWPDGDVLARLEADLKRIVTACGTDSKALRAAGGRASDRMPRTPWKERGEPAPFDAEAALWQVSSVRGVAEKNARELPRVLRETPPTVNEGRAVLDRNRFLAESANRFRGIIRAGEHDVRTGPSGVFGTYVTFFRLPKAATRLRVGDLGTFDFPAGCYGYLGSAFGGGGVRARTHRHLTTDTLKKWNIDWLKPRCTPAAVWWTHERRHVEFDWADLLVALPGATCPVARFGGRDNPAAEAHLFRFDDVPSIAAFRRRVAKAMPGHAPIHEIVVKDWCGNGWPE